MQRRARSSVRFRRPAGRSRARRPRGVDPAVGNTPHHPRLDEVRRPGAHPTTGAG